jgi:hypothetical protein
MSPAIPAGPPSSWLERLALLPLLGVLGLKARDIMGFIYGSK